MKPEEQKIISEHLDDAILKENLSKREAAKFLNLNPCYISMATNGYWSSMGPTAWYRLTQWHNSRGKISEFKFPDNETIWKSIEKPVFPADRIESGRNPDKKLKSPQSGIRMKLINELQIRQKQLQDELNEICKLINQYISL